jgi:hypothetical protein
MRNASAVTRANRAPPRLLAASGRVRSTAQDKKSVQSTMLAAKPLWAYGTFLNPSVVGRKETRLKEEGKGEKGGNRSVGGREWR